MSFPGGVNVNATLSRTVEWPPRTANGAREKTPDKLRLKRNDSYRDVKLRGHRDK